MLSYPDLALQYKNNTSATYSPWAVSPWSVVNPYREVHMECSKMKPYQFCIIKHPTKKEEEGGIGAFLLKHGTLLARDDSQAHVFAGRFIKEEDMGASDRIEVVVRPF